ncbi:MAG: NADH-quinone oxidoreductase subunit L [Verrucomicrobia bacterium]|nr:NADH-quinone oxidoreductase subunit L [Verrucomicrobiota bacterium]
MPWIVENLWLIPFLPFLAAGITALFTREKRIPAAFLVIGAMAFSFLLSLCAGAHVLRAGHGGMIREAFNFTWFAYGDSAVRLGFVLDPLSAMMLFVVSFVSLLIFIFSVGYMDHDENFTRFFCFLSLFAGSMLALVIANSLLLLFMAWELVGLSSYLLIGFWFHKPSAAAAMKKAFITTRIGDIGFFIGLLWFYTETGTSLFYDGGQGSLESAKLGLIAAMGGITALSISLLIFCGAMGKSGQFPLHVWLPDAMEGPTPVSALIHAATMVAAGVFLVGRMYPLFEVDPAALRTVAYVGAFTALFAATIAMAQWDIKRILAYSTVSQLGYMMLGLGVGGYVAGLFHLFTHAFFKALLFLGSGSIIHACHHEQDIRKMGGLKDRMPVTFVTYCVGALALAGVLPFAGFFSKDEILLDAQHFAAKLGGAASVPFCFGLVGAFLTAFYMTRQVKYVFFGKARSHATEHARESSWWMLGPLAALGFMSVFAGFLGFPNEVLGFIGLNKFHHFLAPDLHAHAPSGWIMLGSTAVVLIAIFCGWKIYQGAALEAGAGDPMEARWPEVFRWLNNKYYVDEFYAKTFVWFTHALARAIHFFDRYILNLIFIWGSAGAVYVLSLINQLIDETAINRGFDGGCSTLRRGARWNRWVQNGLSQHYLRITSASIVLLFILALLLGR